MNYAKTLRGHMKLTYNKEACRSISYKNLKLQTKKLAALYNRIGKNSYRSRLGCKDHAKLFAILLYLVFIKTQKSMLNSIN